MHNTRGSRSGRRVGACSIRRAGAAAVALSSVPAAAALRVPAHSVGHNFLEHCEQASIMHCQHGTPAWLRASGVEPAACASPLAAMLSRLRLTGPSLRPAAWLPPSGPCWRRTGSACPATRGGSPAGHGQQGWAAGSGTGRPPAAATWGRAVFTGPHGSSGA